MKKKLIIPTLVIIIISLSVIIINQRKENEQLKKTIGMNIFYTMDGFTLDVLNMKELLKNGNISNDELEMIRENFKTKEVIADTDRLYGISIHYSAMETEIGRYLANDEYTNKITKIKLVENLTKINNQLHEMIGLYQDRVPGGINGDPIDYYNKVYGSDRENFTKKIMKAKERLNSNNY